MAISSVNSEIGGNSSLPRKIGTSEWFLIDQARINKFADATEDWDPLHVDPQWCREHGPFQTTISFGFLTLSLLTRLTQQVVRDCSELNHDGPGYTLNYGLNHVRFVAPVPVDTRIRCHMTLIESQERKPGQMLQRFSVIIEIEDQERPALTAEWLGLRVTDNAGSSRTAAAEQE